MSAFPQVRPYGTGPRARFPYGVRPVTGTLEEQLQASLDAIERAKLIDEMTRLSNRLALRTMKEFCRSSTPANTFRFASMRADEANEACASCGKGWKRFRSTPCGITSTAGNLPPSRFARKRSKAPSNSLRAKSV